jgi:hypothetical protein
MKPLPTLSVWSFGPTQARASRLLLLGAGGCQGSNPVGHLALQQGGRAPLSKVMGQKGPVSFIGLGASGLIGPRTHLPIYLLGYTVSTLTGSSSGRHKNTHSYCGKTDGRSHWLRNVGSRCLGKERWGEYLGIRGTRWQGIGENYITMSLMICTSHQILCKLSNSDRWGGQGVWNLQVCAL